jgi:hypothetical protein
MLSEVASKSLQDSGIVIGDIGTKVSRVPIEKYKASTQKVDRIAFVSKQVMGVKSHYFEGVGSFVCMSVGTKQKKCCELGGYPAVRYLFPVVVYSTDNEGEIVGKKVDLKILSAGEDLYKSIITISRGLQTQGGIDNFDMLVTCTDDKYQKLTLSPIGQANWRKSPSTCQVVTERWEADGEFAYMAIARKVDDESFAKLMNLEDGTGSGGATNPVFNAASNQDLNKFFED